MYLILLFAIVGIQFALSQQTNPNDLEVVLNIEDSNKTQYHEQNFDTSMYSIMYINYYNIFYIKFVFVL